MLEFLKRPQNFFIVFGAIFGALFLFLIPPMQAPDELSHFFRAYQISEGHVMAYRYNISGFQFTGGDMPRSLKLMSYDLQQIGITAREGGAKISTSQITKYLHEPLESSKKDPSQFAGSALYSPIAYVPQVVGIEIGKIFNAPALVLSYLGRSVNLIAFLALAYWAIRLLPIGKWGLVVIALLPTTLTQAASLSADVITNGLAFITIAYFLKLYLIPAKIRAKHILTFAALIILVSLSKETFLILSLLVFLLPIKKLYGRKNYWIFCASVILFSFVLVAVWTYLVRNFVGDMTTSFRPGVIVEPSHQLKNIITDPISYLIVLMRTFSGEQMTKILRTFMGAEYPIYTPLAIIGYATLISTWLSTAKPEIMTKKMRLSLAGVFTVGFAAIVTTLYLTYNVIGAKEVEGLQGRYFIPLVPLLMLVVISGKWQLRIGKYREWYFSFGVLAPLTIMTLQLGHIFYGW